jgi:hypothetical protein
MHTKLVINCETGETQEVELTAEEIAQREADTAHALAQYAADEAAAQAKAQAKATALAKLTALGLTEEEAAALAG